ncbi:uncharacterized protein B0H18DRAFT_955236 [Fomitopsis serialis]|uniref:uncharacterized protein n=1 Tax=Fomitopsis serialis TaxID=139415 RepID=UPI00200747D4|nr:uncharacterized protein B0H18DRAFT_955236 [Neoantrodia serialis]KAH9925187.1 hypothetical protein B0H18DRAFT_955236 [Neoantrodia serialis]
MPVPGVPGSRLSRKRSRSGARKAAMALVAGPSTSAGANSTHGIPHIASSPTVKTASPEPRPVSPPAIAMSLKGKEKAQSPDTSALSAEVASLKAQLAAKSELVSKQRTLLSTLHQSLMCQICLDPLHKPYALAPCGHIACHGCLVAWFQSPPADAHPHDVLPALLRKKTCPHCRAVLRERPIEVWAVKDMVGNFFRSDLADPPMNPPAPDAPDAPHERADPWDGIFRKPLANVAGAGAPLFFPDPPPAAAALHTILGMHDAEDGGIYRCVDCGHEIWDGMCSACDRVYPGHARNHEHAGLDESHGWDEESDGDGDRAEGMGHWLDGVLFGRRRGEWAWPEEGDGDDDGIDEEDVTDVDDEDGSVVYGGAHGFVPMIRSRLFGGLGSASGSEDGDEDDECGYESSFIDDDGAEDGAERHSPPFRQDLAVGGAIGEDDALVVGSDEDGDDLGSEEEDVDFVPPVPARRHRFVVESDEEEEDAPSDEDDGHSVSDSGLADAVADRERIIYGDDGSVPHNFVHSSSPIHVYSDEDDAPAHADHFPLYSDEFAAVEDDHPGPWGEDADEADDHPGSWIDDADEGEQYGHGDEESVYGDDAPASGDEYEYGDAAW